MSLVYFPAWLAVFYGLPFLVALVVIVFVHELGHFLVARWCGVAVEAFSIGFGKEITGWYDRHGTRWKLSWLPFGGYVKFRGDANAASFPERGAGEGDDDPNNFHNKPVWQRAAVVVAGPMANFILAISIFTVAFWLIGVPVIDARVGEVIKGSAAEQAGVKVGDLITAVDGKPIDDFFDLRQAMMNRDGDALTITVNRDGSALTLNATPTLAEEPDGFGGKIRMGRLGVAPSDKAAHIATYGLRKSFDKGVDRTWFIVSSTGHYLGKLFTGREKPDQLGGVISAGKMAGDAAAGGFFDFINAIALLSVSIGLINLFPIPMLDGGHLVYYAIEAVRGKPLGQNAQEWGMRIGFSLVIVLMLVGNGNDLIRVFMKIIGG